MPALVIDGGCAFSKGIRDSGDSKSTDGEDASDQSVDNAHSDTGNDNEKAYGETGRVTFAESAVMSRPLRRTSLSTVSTYLAGSRRVREMSSLFGTELDEELSEAISQNVSFEGAHHLMRAVRLNRVLAGMARLFKQSEGSAATYQLSEHATSLRYFLSHNWVVPRWDKYLALTYKFNGNLALFFALSFCALCGVLGALNLLPTIEDKTFHVRVGYVCRLLAAPLALFMLSFGSSISALLGFLGPLVFLDKVCIHQVDAGLQQQGIARLGAFLRISERMLVLYSDVYFRKLWTIYEVANFLALHSVDDIEVVPVMLPRLMFGVLPLCYFYTSMVMLLRAVDVSGQAMYLIVFLAAAIYSVILRRWARHKQATQEGLLSFEVKKCTCAVESDRPIVYSKIADLMRAKGLIDRRAPVEEGLKAFDASVRRRLPQAFSIIFGSSAFTYKYYVFIASMLVLPQSMDYVMRLHLDDSAQQVIASRTHDMMWIFTFWPLIFWSLEVMASKKLHWTGCNQFFYLWAVITLQVVLAAITHTILTECEKRASESVFLLKVLIATALALTLFTWLVVAFAYRWTPCGAWRERQRKQKHRREQAELRRQQREKELQQQREEEEAAARRESDDSALAVVVFDVDDEFCLGDEGQRVKPGQPNSWEEDKFTLPASKNISL